MISLKDFEHGGKPVDGVLELHFADGSTFAHPVIAGRIVKPEPATIDLAPTEYHRLDFGKLD